MKLEENKKYMKSSKLVKQFIKVTQSKFFKVCNRGPFSGPSGRVEAGMVSDILVTELNTDSLH
jgi:hypothetical protein